MTRRLHRVVAALLALLLAGPPLQAADRAALAAYRGPPSGWPAAQHDPGVAFVELGPLPNAPPPTPQQRAQAALGRALFADPRLSASGRIACASCHDPARGWSVDAPVATGIAGRRGRRNPPDLRQAGAHAQWGWDGRGATLAAQALAPLLDPDEMGNPSVQAVLERLQARPGPAAGLTPEALGEALAAHVRQAGVESEQAAPTRYERFLRGERQLLTPQELQGLHLFRTKARCVNCHHGPWLSDGLFHNLRLSSFGEPAEDRGRQRVSGRPEDTGAFRTPSLRRVAESPPYLHNGLIPSLQGVLRLYLRGGGEVWARNAAQAAQPLYPHAARLSPLVRPLDLDEEEQAALVAFLRTL
ncbi:cytochrome-c peroxidase [Pseudorhodoferax sp.]|uniref:cytochrome-c peroxidase n=1 Tax=Pseudorhodoferax sp. TaxID=1993553 RepID=UPI002DD69BBE|nr:cytochrome c peroxidase [Pseudorhodoferax sp.]